MFLVMGAVGNDDFAMEAGLIPPPLWETAFLSLLGLAIAASAIPKIQRQYGDE
jgi:hypothetical protein|tara:strand:- start:7704 stop:7862 length:159 start_codon:yes stop_codon:yes gene_type:complete